MIRTNILILIIFIVSLTLGLSVWNSIYYEKTVTGSPSKSDSNSSIVDTTSNSRIRNEFNNHIFYDITRDDGKKTPDYSIEPEVAKAAEVLECATLVRLNLTNDAGGKNNKFSTCTEQKTVDEAKLTLESLALSGNLAATLALAKNWVFENSVLVGTVEKSKSDSALPSAKETASGTEQKRLLAQLEKFSNSDSVSVLDAMGDLYSVTDASGVSDGRATAYRIVSYMRRDGVDMREVPPWLVEQMSDSRRAEVSANVREIFNKCCNK